MVMLIMMACMWMTVTGSMSWASNGTEPQVGDIVDDSMELNEPYTDDVQIMDHLRHDLRVSRASQALCGKKACNANQVCKAAKCVCKPNTFGTGCAYTKSNACAGGCGVFAGKPIQCFTMLGGLGNYCFRHYAANTVSYSTTVETYCSTDEDGEETWKIDVRDCRHYARHAWNGKAWVVVNTAAKPALVCKVRYDYGRRLCLDVQGHFSRFATTPYDGAPTSEVATRC
jgi:hypothetical protein